MRGAPRGRGGVCDLLSLAKSNLGHMDEGLLPGETIYKYRMVVDPNPHPEALNTGLP